MIGYLYILGTVLLTTAGQLVLKWRINQVQAEQVIPEASAQKLLFLLKLVIDPFVMLGLGLAFGASIFWMAAMTRFDVSYAYPFITAGLTLVTVFAAIAILGEPLTPMRVGGVVLIAAGAALMARGL